MYMTTRQFREVDELIELENIDANVVERYGGATLEGKLAASARRIERLSHMISEVNPDLSIACTSPDAARTAFGLGIPHFTINDSPHSVFVARLTIPLSSKLFSPAIIPKTVWMGLGARRDQILQYNSLDPIAWLNAFSPNYNILSELGLDASKPIIVFRAEEAFASYLLGYSRVDKPIFLPIVAKLLNEYDQPISIVILPRYDEQISVIKSAFQDRVLIPQKVIDGPSLLLSTSVFIGAGGTMTAEAALLGTPTLSCYPREPTIVERFLTQKKLIHRITDPDQAYKRIIQILENYNDVKRIQQERAKTLMFTLEDPIDFIVDIVERYSS